VHDYRTKVWISLSQSTLNLLSLYMSLAEGDMRIENGVEHEVKLFD
jgi:hypothetical protein